MADSTIRYPYRTFRYTVEIDGIARGGFSEVSGFDLNVDVVEYRATICATPRASCPD